MNERETSLPLKRGLFVLRYVSSHATGAAPQVSVRPVVGAESVVEIISAPGDRAGVIEVPGRGLVIRAQAATTLLITVHSAGGRNADAELRLEPIGSSDASAESPMTNAQEGLLKGQGRTGRQPVLEILGHVSRRGDLRVSAGEWIAGPDAPAPIEGIALDVEGHPGVALEYQALIGGPNGSWTQWSAGGYVGTRGKFKALHGIRLRLTGVAASALEIEAQALFLGSSAMTRKGSNIELISPAGADPMVGLRIALFEDQSRSRAKENGGANSSAAGASRDSGRVRVFRASSLR